MLKVLLDVIKQAPKIFRATGKLGTSRAKMARGTATIGKFVAGEALISYVGTYNEWVKENGDWLLLGLGVRKGYRKVLSKGKTMMGEPFKAFFAANLNLSNAAKVFRSGKVTLSKITKKGTENAISIARKGGAKLDIRVDVKGRKIKLSTGNKLIDAALISMPVGGLAAILDGNQEALEDLAASGLAMAEALATEMELVQMQEYLRELNPLTLMGTIRYVGTVCESKFPNITREHIAAEIMDVLQRPEERYNAHTIECATDEEGNEHMLFNGIHLKLEGDALTTTWTEAFPGGDSTCDKIKGFLPVIVGMLELIEEENVLPLTVSGGKIESVPEISDGHMIQLVGHELEGHPVFVIEGRRGALYDKAVESFAGLLASAGLVEDESQLNEVLENVDGVLLADHISMDAFGLNFGERPTVQVLDDDYRGAFSSMELNVASDKVVDGEGSKTIVTHHADAKSVAEAYKIG